MAFLDQTTLQLSTALIGTAFLAVALWGWRRWTGHTAGGLVLLLLTVGGSAVLFALSLPAVPLYQLVWLYTLLAVPIAFALFSFAYAGIDVLQRPVYRIGFVAPAALGAVAGTLLSISPTSTGAGGRLLMPVMRAHMGGGIDAATQTAMHRPTDRADRR